ncbi:MAG: galactokinase [Thermomicrobiales bacterium]
MRSQSESMPEKRAIAAGRAAWGASWKPVLRSVAPGRVELLGNHVDYNGGPVLAAAIDRKAIALFEETRGPDSGIEIAFADYGEYVQLETDFPGDWKNESGTQRPSDYARGALAALHSRGRPIRPSRISLSSSVPAGIGVSSSAALCVALLQAMSFEPLTSNELILCAQEAEHRAGTPCGTMDQSASVAGGVILFNGATLEFERLSPSLGDMSFLVVDSGVHRSLASSSYPIRVSECKAAIELLNGRFAARLNHLAELSMNDFEHVAESVADSGESLLFDRVRHVVEETARVREGRTALEALDWESFGALMTASGRSSATLYDISHPTVERIVNLMLTDPSVGGARMMGGGEGGSLIALVRNGADPDVRKRLERLVNSDLPAGASRREIFSFSFADGAEIVDLES